MYTISWEADFEYELFEPRTNNWPDAATRLPQDAASGDVDFYVIDDERYSTNEDERSSRERNKSDVIENELRPSTTNSRETASPRDELTDQPQDENDVTKNELRPRPACSRDASSLPDKPPNGTENENDVTNDLERKEFASNGGGDITVPGISENEKK